MVLPVRAHTHNVSFLLLSLNIQITEFPTCQCFAITGSFVGFVFAASEAGIAVMGCNVLVASAHGHFIAMKAWH